MNIFSFEKVIVVIFFCSGLNGYLNGMNFVVFINDDKVKGVGIRIMDYYCIIFIFNYLFY